MVKPLLTFKHLIWKWLLISVIIVFRERVPIIYEGDLMNEEALLDFLTSLEAMDLPDRIEEVNGKILSKVVEETDYIAVLFCTFDYYEFKCYVFIFSFF